MNNWKVYDMEDQKGWRSLGFEKTGDSHRKNGKPRQDAVRIIKVGDCLVAAVSDGVGSLVNSHIAANAAVDAVVGWFQTKYRDLNRDMMLTDTIREELVRELRKKLTQAAKASHVELETMDCNLAFVFVMPQYRAIYGCLGDCAVCVVGEKSRVLSSYSRSANATDTILGDHAESKMQIDHCSLYGDEVQGFLLSTDGLEGEVYLKNTEVLRKRAEDYFNTLLDKEPIKRLQSLVDGLPPYFDDDIGMAVLSRASNPIILEDDPTWMCSCGHRNPVEVLYCEKCRKDFVALYKNARIGRDRVAFFRRLNRNPAEERTLLNMLSGVEVTEQPVVKQEAKQPGQDSQDDSSWNRERGPWSSKSFSRTEAVPRNTKPPVEAGLGEANLNWIMNAFSKPKEPEEAEKQPHEEPASRKSKRERSKNKTLTNDMTTEHSAPDHSAAETAENVRRGSGPIWWNVILSLLVLIEACLIGWQLVELTRLSDRLDRIEEFVEIPEEEAGWKPYLVNERYVMIWSVREEESCAEARRGDVVAVSPDQRETDENGEEWVWVRTQDGIEGWCRFAALISMSAEPET